MEAVNKILGREVPATNGIPVTPPEKDKDSLAPAKEVGKKIVSTVDNLTEAEHKRGQLIRQIQSLYKSGISIREITRITGRNRNTVENIFMEIQICCVEVTYEAPWTDKPIL